MTGIDQGWEMDDCDEPDDDGDWRDYDDDDWEPDPEDAEIARSDELYWAHCDAEHGGEHCDCRAPLRDRLAWAWWCVRRLGRRLLRRPSPLLRRAPLLARRIL